MVFLWPKIFSLFYSFLDDWLVGCLAGWLAHISFAVVYNFSFSLQSAEHEPNLSQSNAIKIRPVHTCSCASIVFHIAKHSQQPKSPRGDERAVCWAKLRKTFYFSCCDSLQFTKLKVGTEKTRQVNKSSREWDRMRRRDDGKVRNKKSNLKCHYGKMKQPCEASSHWRSVLVGRGMAYANQMRHDLLFLVSIELLVVCLKVARTENKQKKCKIKRKCKMCNE